MVSRLHKQEAMRTVWLVILSLSLWATPAAADTHFDVMFSFLGGQRGYENATFGYSEGTASPALGGSFRAEPFSGVAVAGPGGEATLVVDGLRFSFGVQSPYARLTSSQSTTRIFGSPTVQVHGLDIRELRYGLGLETKLDRLTLHADLMGTVDNVVARLTVGDKHSSYQSKNFSFSGRVGGQYEINDNYFVHAAIEAGLGGNIDVGGYAGVGFRLQ